MTLLTHAVATDAAADAISQITSGSRRGPFLGMALLVSWHDANAMERDANLRAHLPDPWTR